MHPILFRIGDFPIATYGVMIVIGFAAALLLANYLAKRRNMPAEFVYDLSFILLFSGFLGARVLFVLLNLDSFFRAPFATLFAREGFVFMGGFVTAFAVGIWYVRRKRMPLWETADIGAPCVVLAHGFGRIGCFLAGCCYGRVCPPDAVWAISFPRVLNSNGELELSFAYLDHLRQGIIDRTASGSLPVYPTQLMESASNFIISGLLLLVLAKRRFSGQVFLTYLVLYGTARFGIEFFRGDADRGLWLGDRISTSQIFSLIAIAAAFVGWAVLRTKKGAPPRRRPAHGK